MTDKIRSRIAAVVAKANSTTNQAEAETFMAMARKLMEEHQIFSVELETEGNGDGLGGIETVHSKPYQPGTPAAEKYDLMAAVASYFGCQVLCFGNPKRKRLDIHGDSAALATFDAMFPFVWGQVLNLARDKHPHCPKLRRQLQRDLGRALQIRLYRLKEETRAARNQEAGQGTGTALVLVDLDARVNEYVESFYDMPIGEAKQSNKRGPGYRAQALAETVSLDRPIEG